MVTGPLGSIHGYAYGTCVTSTNQPCSTTPQQSEMQIYGGLAN